MAAIVHTSRGQRTGTLLAALMVTAIATAGCREPRHLVVSPDSEEDGGQLMPGGETEDGDTDAEAAADAVVGGRGDGSGGHGAGGAVTVASSGGIGATVGSGGRTGAGTGGAVVGSGGGRGTGGTVGSGGTGGVIVTGSGGRGSGGAMMTTASGGTTGGGNDAGSDGAPTCTGANHACNGSCVSNASVNSCGSSCSPCPAPAGGGTGTCEGNTCGISCPSGKSCNGKCITSGGCCADADCSAQGGGAAGKCDTSTNLCQSATRTTLYSFDTGIQPWTLYTTSPTRLGDKTHLTFDAHNGEGSTGALKVEAPFDAPNQKVEFQDTQATPLGLDGRTIHARVRLAKGLSDDASHPGAIKLFAKSGANYDYASGAWTNLLGSSWVDVTLIADQPDFVQGTFSPGEIRQVGFELRVFSETQRSVPATIFVDSIWY